jgi:ribonuclease E
VQAPEAASAVADFEGVIPQAQPAPAEYDAPPVGQPAAAPSSAQAVAEAEAHAHDAEKAARRRSTVREKVSFGSSSQTEPAAPSYQPQAAAPAETQAGSASEATTEAPAPRRAGWWSRRFGGGE